MTLARSAFASGGSSCLRPATGLNRFFKSHLGKLITALATALGIETLIKEFAKR